MTKKFIGVKVTGMKEIQKKLKKMERGIKKETKPKKIPVTTLLSNEFIRKHTRYTSFTDFVVNSGIVSNEDGITEDILSSREFDSYVKNTTRFSSWNSMLEEATVEHYSKQLGFK